MDEYIERKAALDCLKRYPSGERAGEKLYCAELRAARDDSNDLPAADVAPVVHARWIRGVPGDNEPRCSNCLGYQPWFFGYGYYDPDHCPHCGAIMDLREQVDEDEQDL